MTDDGAATTEDQRRRLLLVALAVVVVVLILVFSVCSGGGSDDEAAPLTTTQPPATTTGATDVAASPATIATPPPTEASTTTAAADTTTDPFAQFLVDTTIEWRGCELIDRGDGGYVAACSNATHPFFENWLVQIAYETDGDGTRVAISGSISGYSAGCAWDPPSETPTYRSELVDGVATHEGSMLGTGLCDGLVWNYSHSWDDNAQTLVSTGLIERAA